MRHRSPLFTKAAWSGQSAVFSAVVLVVTGAAVISITLAATSPIAFETEAGAVAAGAVPTAVTGASGGSAVKFASAAPVTHDYVQDFTTAVAAWPSDGSPAPGYGPSGVNTGGFCAYPDGMNGTHNAPSVYWPSHTVSVHDGYLDFWDHNSQAAAILPFCYSGFLYGTYSVQMRVTAGGGDAGGGYAGYHNAFLLWPNDGNGTWPAAGEFDYPESDTSVSNPYMAIVQPNGTFLPATTTRTAQPWTDGLWHTYTQQWGPGFIRTYQDGVLVGTVTSGIPTWKMHPVLQNEWYSVPDPAISGHTQVTRITYDRSYTLTPAQF